MTRTSLRVFAMTALLSTVGAVLGSGEQDRALQEVAGYREWTRVNQTPIPVENLGLGSAGD